MIEYLILGTLAIIAVVFIAVIIIVSKSDDEINIKMDMKKGKLDVRKKKG